MAKKGITAVVAIVLLLMMTVAAAGLAYLWVSSLQQSAQDDTTNVIDAQKDKMQTSMGIDSTWRVGGVAPYTISFVLRNTGKTGFTEIGGAAGFKLYIDGALVATPLTMAGALAPQGIVQIDTAAAWPGVGSERTIKVVTTNGVEVVKKCSVTATTQTSC